MKKDPTPTSEDSKLVYLYRSDKKVSVCDPQDPTQYAGKPIQYTPVQQVQGNGTIQYTTEQQMQQPIMYQPYPSYPPGAESRNVPPLITRPGSSKPPPSCLSHVLHC